MRDFPEPAMLDKIKALFTFERLIGPPLVAIIYFFGILGIGGGTLIWMLLGVIRLTSDLGAGLMMLLAVPAIGAVLLVLWRFFCELCMIAFANHELLREIRDRQRADYPQF
jgi:hypothetical protein